jgi:hypothetical protein
MLGVPGLGRAGLKLSCDTNILEKIYDKTVETASVASNVSNLFRVCQMSSVMDIHYLQHSPLFVLPYLVPVLVLLVVVLVLDNSFTYRYR